MGEPLTECPATFIGADMAAIEQIAEAADFARNGSLPAAGGTGDQTVAGLEGIRAVWKADRVIADHLENDK